MTTPQQTPREPREALQALESVLCDPEGRACIHGSAGDLKVIDDALATLSEVLAPQVASGQEDDRYLPEHDLGGTEPIEADDIDANVAAVRAKLKERAQRGLAKYGVTTERDDLSRMQWLKHAQEEAMDLAIYLEKLIQTEP